MSNGWYSITETYVHSLTPTDLMVWVGIYDLDPDEDLDEIREQVVNIMSRKEAKK